MGHCLNMTVTGTCFLEVIRAPADNGLYYYSQIRLQADVCIS